MMQLASFRLQATFKIDLPRHGVVDPRRDRNGGHGVEVDEEDVVDHVVQRRVLQHLDLFLRVGDLSLMENGCFAVRKNAVVHVVHVRLTHGRSFLNDLSRLNVLDVIKPSNFFIGFHCCSRPPLLRYYI